MASEDTKNAVTYGKEAIFRRLAELYFSLGELDPSFGANVEGEEFILEEDGEFDVEVALDPEEVADGDKLPPFLALDEAYAAFQQRMFDQFFGYSRDLLRPSTRTQISGKRSQILLKKNTALRSF